MKTKYNIAVAIILAGLSSTALANYVYTQNFDNMGTTGTTALSGWTEMNIAGDSTSLLIPTSAEMATASVGSGASLAVWNQTSPNASSFLQAVNMGSTATDANRLLGTVPTSVRGEILGLSLLNDSGVAITTVSVAYDMKAMANGTLKAGQTATHEELPGYRFYYLDGSTWLHLATLDLANDTLNSVGHAPATLNYTTPVANNGTMQFRWFDDDGDQFSPDFAFAIDNVSVVVPEPGTLSLLAVGALALIFRRRQA